MYRVRKYILNLLLKATTSEAEKISEFCFRRDLRLLLKFP